MRLLRGLVAAAIALLAIAFMSLSLLAARAPHGVTGAWIDAVDGSVRQVIAESPASAAGLAAGDRVLLDRLSLADRFELVGGVTPGDRRLAITIVHPDGAETQRQLFVVAYAQADPEIVLPVLRIVVFAIGILAAAGLVVAEGSLVAWLALAFAMLTAPSYGSMLATAPYPDPLVRAAAVFAVLSLAGGYVMAALLARFGDVPGARLTRAQRVFLGIAGAAVLLGAGEGLGFEHLDRFRLEVPRDLGFLVAIAALLLRVRATHGAVRNRVRWIAAATIPVLAAQIATIGYAESGVLLGLDQLGSARLALALDCLVVVFPCAVVYLTLAPVVGDARRGLARASSRAIVIGALALAALGVVAAAVVAMKAPAAAAPLAAVVAIAFGLALRAFLLALRRNANGAKP
jgi:hypothetical protein